MDGWIEEERDSFPDSKISSRGREGIRKPQNHNQANTMLIISGKIHGWMLKSVGESSKRHIICMVSRNLPPHMY